MNLFAVVSVELNLYGIALSFNRRKEFTRVPPVNTCQPISFFILGHICNMICLQNVCHDHNCEINSKSEAGRL